MKESVGERNLKKNVKVIKRDKMTTRWRKIEYQGKRLCVKNRK